MSTDITTTTPQGQALEQAGGSPSTYLALTRPGSRAARAFAENFGESPFDINELTKVSVPAGGGTTWDFESIRGSESLKEIEGVIVGMARRGTLWPSEGDIDPDRRPVLNAVSPWGTPLTAAVRPLEGEADEDFGDIDPEVLEAHKLGEIDGISIYDWASLPYCQWGSASKGDGKRAKETVDVYLLRKDDTLPLRISIPPASLKDWGKAVRALPFSYRECVVGLSLEKVTPAKGPAYARVVPRYIAELSEEEGAAIIDLMGKTLAVSIAQQCLPDNKVAALIAAK